ncbi:hypothetical protein [Streptomyces sp. CB03238]|uniref:hypothetical protein n=1 Tax=Streptomyces sp. CB03238 TaxID=1907777 RepID=UPI00118045ED|nr:hypothetical protein [Streptomyces sp. CB03238]
MSDDFEQTVQIVHSADHLAIRAAAGAWIALAAAAQQGQDQLRGAAQRTTQEKGEGLAELATRLEALSSWGGGASDVAMAIGRQLQTAGDATAVAAERVISLQVEYEKQSQGAQSDAGTGRQEQERQLLGEEARKVLRTLDSEYGRVTGGGAPTAPDVGAASADGGDGRGTADAARPAAAGTSADGPSVAAPNGSEVGAGAYPHASVVGPEGGEFAGWVTSPSTGFLVDPVTGREFDPVTGRWIDPVTGRPFGAVTEYATRLSGLGDGPGALALVTGVGLVATGGAGVTNGGLGSLYGGVVPPGVGAAGPTSGQVSQQALRNLAHRAEVANRFAQREAALGGRPYMPPPGAAHCGAARGNAPRGGPGRTPLPGAGGVFRGGGVRTADALARHGLAPRPAPAPPAPSAAHASAADRRPQQRRSGGDLTEDPDVWSSGRTATHGTLGEIGPAPGRGLRPGPGPGPQNGRQNP